MEDIFWYPDEGRIRLQEGSLLEEKRVAVDELYYKRHYGRFVNSFDISDDIKGHHVLLLDDVSTTGKSMMVVHDLMMDKLPTSVYCLALGRTAPPRWVMSFYGHLFLLA